MGWLKINISILAYCHVNIIFAYCHVHGHHVRMLSSNVQNVHFHHVGCSWTQVHHFHRQHIHGHHL